MHRTYQPDNETVRWVKKENGMLLIQAAEAWTGIQKEMKITLDPEKAKVTLLHRLKNCGAWEIRLAAWALTLMKAGGLLVLPQVTDSTGLLPNRSLSLWSYTKLNDPRFRWGERYLAVQSDPLLEQPLKIGLQCRNGWAAYLRNRHLFVKRYVPVPHAPYPDYGSGFEAFVNQAVTEMETLSPLSRVKPGETLEHTETWYLLDGVEVPESERQLEEIEDRITQVL